eukprot:CAMPEP_0203881384 /NCGR_PEP_ID=MMETSP0359-20131031/25683_1 /ASSEMBLY_ACC=CAM_ASM_000338 /TAXON_ID=268821 /ORGANISM="Scrippsiella Hangoei, Strain SHTV-5" /LENGTH=46 /DNA_ID= /DNA_START= /DNA_END= /DNA_ORIENTATION=
MASKAEFSCGGIKELEAQSNKRNKSKIKRLKALKSKHPTSKVPKHT